MIEICLGLVVIACIIIILYLLFYSRDSLKVDKSVSGGDVHLRVTTKKDIRRLEVSGEGLGFVRTGLKKGESVEFVFPFTEGKLQLLFQDEDGNHRIEV